MLTLEKITDKTSDYEDFHWIALSQMKKMTVQLTTAVQSLHNEILKNKLNLISYENEWNDINNSMKKVEIQGVEQEVSLPIVDGEVSLEMSLQFRPYGRYGIVKEEQMEIYQKKMIRLFERLITVQIGGSIKNLDNISEETIQKISSEMEKALTNYAEKVNFMGVYNFLEDDVLSSLDYESHKDMTIEDLKKSDDVSETVIEDLSFVISSIENVQDELNTFNKALHSYEMFFVEPLIKQINKIEKEVIAFFSEK